MRIVELRIGNNEQGASDTVSCRREFWELMLALGDAFGWKAAGTSYLATSFKGTQSQPTRRHDYLPGAWSDAKRISADDAFAWAAALRLARESAHLDNMLAARQSVVVVPGNGSPYADDANIRESIDDFIGILRKGALSFAEPDAVESTSAAATRSIANASG